MARGDVNLEPDGALCYAEIRTSARKVKRIQARIEKLLADIAAIDEAGEDAAADAASLARYRLTLAFFPLSKPMK
jgi:hypothetical protein